MRDAVIVSAVRTAAGKAPGGTLRYTRPDEMAATVIKEALARAPGLDPAEIDDVILGCAMPEAEQGLNVARIASLRAGIPVSASAVTVNRFCSSGLQAIAQGAERIMAGFADAIVAGGTESMSLVPMGGHKIAPNPIAGGQLSGRLPHHGARGGEPRARGGGEPRGTGRVRARQPSQGRRRHRRGTVQGRDRAAAGAHRRQRSDDASIAFDTDEGPRRDTSPEALAKLRPAFHVTGTVTAGNSSQTSDGAAAVVVMSGERARALGIAPLARFVAFATAGVEPERFGIGPVPAIRKVLKMAGLTLDQIDLVEFNEAFAAQVIACLRELPIDRRHGSTSTAARSRSAIRSGCTGAKLTATLLHEMRRRGSRYGMVSMCVGGGMGAAGIFERM